MKYLLLLFDDEQAWSTRPAEDQSAMMAGHEAFGRDLHAVGAYVAGEALQPVATATTIRVSDGKALVSDGPFAETKEQLGGFYMIDVADLDEALKWGSRVAEFNGGSVEVRPVWEFA
ncbi:MAG TPA: YciI family protein [Thermomicrobiaceae bacterium]|nr:YciI family protein [Thermomicrobiaceae bacterium]